MEGDWETMTVREFKRLITKLMEKMGNDDELVDDKQKHVLQYALLYYEKEEKGDGQTFPPDSQLMN